jgi:hypothetical protein
MNLTLIHVIRLPVSKPSLNLDQPIQERAFFPEIVFTFLKSDEIPAKNLLRFFNCAHPATGINHGADVIE